MSTRVAIINMKGGVGKTTLSVQLAYWFAERRGKRVLLVDLDPQFNATQYMLGEYRTSELFAANRPTIWHVFENGEQHPAGRISIDDPFAVLVPVHPAPFWKPAGSPPEVPLYVLPSQLELAYSLRSPFGKERRLEDFLSKVESQFDLILLDCAPTLSLLTTAAYHSTDYIIVPVKTEYLSSIGLTLLVNSLDEFTATQVTDTRKPRLAGILFNETDDYSPEEAIVKRDVSKLAEDNSWPVFENSMPYSRSFAKGARNHTPIHRTSYARDEMKDRFSSLAGEISRSIGWSY